MKTRAQLNYFLRKRGTSLRKICRENSIKDSAQLGRYLDELGVEHPSDKELLDLFAKERRTTQRKNKQVVSVKSVERSNSDSLDNASEKLESRGKTGQNRSRRRSRGKNRPMATPGLKSKE